MYVRFQYRRNGNALSWLLVLLYPNLSRAVCTLAIIALFRCVSILYVCFLFIGFYGLILIFMNSPATNARDIVPFRLQI